MAYEGPVAELPCGRAGMVVRTNRLNAVPGELLDANGIQFDNLTLRKEAGAVLLDSVGIPGAPAFVATYGISVAWFGLMASFKGNGSFVKNIDAQSPSTPIPATPPAMTFTVPVGGVPANDLLVVGIGRQSSIASVSPLGVITYNLLPKITTIIDTQGNTYTNAFPGFEDPTRILAASFWYSFITTPLVAGNTITVSFDRAGSFATGAVDQYTGVTAIDHTAQASTAAISGTSTAKMVGPLAPLSQIPELIVDVDVAQATLAAASLTPQGGSGWTARTTSNNTNSSKPVQVRMFSRTDTTTPSIIGLFDFNPQFIFAGTGTITTTKGSATVVGVGTAFLSQVNIGDEIRIGGEIHRVIAVASDTSLTTAEPWFTTNAGSAFTVVEEQRLVTATSDGNIYKEIQGDIDFFNPKSGLAPSIVPGRFVLGGRESGPAKPRKLFWFDGRDPVQVLNGNTNAIASIAQPPADWSGANQPVNGVIHQNRLVGFGNINDPHRLYFSSQTDHEDFLTTVITLEVYSGIGDRLWCAQDFQGLLYAWKYPVGIFFIDDSDPNIANWILRLKSSGLGCAPSPHTVLPIDDDILFMAANGSFHLLSAVNTLGGTRASDLSYLLGISKWLREHMNLGRLSQVVSVWYPHKKQAFFAVPSTNSVVNDLVLRFDFGGAETGAQAIRFSYSKRDAPGAMATRRDLDTIPRPIFGEAGFVYIEDQDARNKAGQSYAGTFQLPQLDFSHVDPRCRVRRKIPKHLGMVFEPSASGVLVVQPVVDGVNVGPPLTFDPTRRRQRQRLNVGDGYTFSLIGTESTLNGDFSIDDILVWFTIGDEDESRGSE